MLTDPYSHWQNAAEESRRKIIRIYEKKRVQKGVPKRLFTYLINWCCDTRNATALETPELDSKTPHAWMLSETDDISHILMHDFYNPFKYTPNLPQGGKMTKLDNTLALPVTPPKSTPTMP